jgi:GTP pyrophosphokinase
MIEATNSNDSQRDVPEGERLLGEAREPNGGAARFTDGSDALIGRSRACELSIGDTVGLADPALVTENRTPEERFAYLQETTRSYLSQEDEDLLERAFLFARDAHAGQCRKSGEPFVSHPVEVAIVLGDLRMDVETIAAALLHDVVEDTEVTKEDLAEAFNEPIAELVDGVTKITRIEVENLSDEQAQTIRKMFVAMNKDIRVIVIKLADRLHNMRTLSALREDRRIFKARETLEIYAPIAHRMGISQIKWELEDLAFFYLEPNKYKQISRMVAESRVEREEYLGNVIDILRDEMDKVHINCSVMGRPKHLYSIYRKMTTRGKGFSEIYDLIAVRIIVDTVAQCYSALGAVHILWHPMPGRFKDYIAMPKFNMYQSLHTTVIGPAGRPLEVQIRTVEMHRMSEYGVAAHWRYKEGSSRGDANFDQQLAWLRQMVDWQGEMQDSREFLKSLKVDLAPSEVFVFTPQGDAMQLRAGSTPVDFAYAVHTEVGNHCVGAKVNGSIVPLSYELQMGDRVEVLTQKSAGPSRDWIDLVKTPRARSKIRAYFTRASRSTDVQEGHERLTREMRKHGLGISSTNGVRALKAVAAQMGFNDTDDMLVAVGTGKESTQGIANRLLKILADKGSEELDEKTLGKSDSSTGKLPPMLTSVRHPKTKKQSKPSNGIIVKGLDGVLVRLSRCCNPVPGDDIVGFITRGRGVSVHRRDCPNATSLMEHPERIIDVEWENSPHGNTTYKVEVHIDALDRMNLLRDVVAVLSEAGANVLTSSTASHRDSMVEMRFLFQVGSVSSIERILTKLKAVEGVFDAHRMMPK